jgi:hypothetical protein
VSWKDYRLTLERRLASIERQRSPEHLLGESTGANLVIARDAMAFVKIEKVR